MIGRTFLYKLFITMSLSLIVGGADIAWATDLSTFQTELDGCNSRKTIDPSESCNITGYNYQYGKGIERDIHKARLFYEKSCEQGNSQGCTNLGHIFAVGNGVPRNAIRAVNLYEKGCRDGNQLSCTHLGEMYFNGAGLDQNDDKAVALVKTACDASIPEACDLLGWFHIEGIGGQINSARGFTQFKQFCNDDHAYSCDSLGLSYANGIGTSVNIKKAEASFRKGCDADYPDACNSLGNYYNGVGINIFDSFTPRPQKAKTFYQKACDLGSSGGCVNLGIFYIQNGMEDFVRSKNNNQFLKGMGILDNACFAGNGEGCNRLGFIHGGGLVVPQDIALSWVYKEKACQLEFPKACVAVGRAYLKGINGFEKNEIKAVELFDYACHEGAYQGCLELSDMYREGLGVTKDLKKADRYYQVACKNPYTLECVDRKN